VESRLLDIPEAAARLKTTPRHIRELIATRRLSFVKVGRLVRFDPDDIAAFIEAGRVDATEARRSLSSREKPPGVVRAFQRVNRLARERDSR
jgi:excisionase family DNA binding protein